MLWKIEQGLLDPIFLKFRNQQNEFMMLEVVLSWVMTGEGMRGHSGVPEIFSVLICVPIYVKSHLCYQLVIFPFYRI